MRRSAAGLAVVVGLIAAFGATSFAGHGENVHAQADACVSCHTMGAAQLKAAGPKAGLALKSNLEAECNRCHSDTGPSHKTGVLPTHPVPPDLPLGADGKLACNTCHYMHAEHNDFGAYLRRDNRRGGLCLTCHTMDDLQK